MRRRNSIVVGGGPGSIVWEQNRPAGLTLHDTEDWAGGDQPNPEPRNLVQYGAWLFFGNQQVVAEPSAPSTSKNVMRLFTEGGSFGNGAGRSSGRNAVPFAAKRMYVCALIYFSLGYRVHANTEKFFYPLGTNDRFAPFNNTHNAAFNIYSTEPETGDIGFVLNPQTIEQGPPGDPTGGLYYSTATLKRGVFNQVELFAQQNTGAGTKDGIWRMWQNGVLTADFNVVNFGGNWPDHWFSSNRIDDTRGGGPDSAPVPAGGQFRLVDRVSTWISNTLP